MPKKRLLRPLDEDALRGQCRGSGFGRSKTCALRQHGCNVQRRTGAVHQDREQGERWHRIVRIGVRSMHAGRLVENGNVQSIWIGTSVILSLTSCPNSSPSSSTAAAFEPPFHVMATSDTNGSMSVTGFRVQPVRPARTPYSAYHSDR